MHEGSAAQEQWAKANVPRAEQEKAAFVAGLVAAEPPGDDLNDELQAMRSMARTLEKLPPAAADRVLTWLCNRMPRLHGEVPMGLPGVLQRGR